MESQHFGHQHPLLFHEGQSNRSEAAHCSRCGEGMSGPSFSCAECVFYLHKACAEAPSQINHPFHRDHPLCLLSNPPAGYEGRFLCNFCGETGEMFVYHCSCDIDLHIKCALFTCNISENNFGDVQGIAIKDPSFPTQNTIREPSSFKCYWCWEPLSESACYSLDPGFNLHKKCVELSFEIDNPLDRSHLLTLQFSVCTKTDGLGLGLGYCCSVCNISIHVACLPLLPMEDGHKHQFTVLLRQMPFTCDACGVEENSVPYTCSICNLLVHKECISFLALTYKDDNTYSESHFCDICEDDRNPNHWFYYCTICDTYVHPSCVSGRGAYLYVKSGKTYILTLSDL